MSTDNQAIYWVKDPHFPLAMNYGFLCVSDQQTWDS